MFDIAKSETFWAAVEFEYTDEHGARRPETFDALFPRMTNEDIEALKERIRRENLSDNDVVRDVVRGWRKVRNRGEEIEFSPAALGQMLNIVGVGSAIAFAFFKNQGSARIKN